MIFPFPDKGFLGRALSLKEPRMVGNDVIAWQQHLSITADGTFGKATHLKTLEFQETMGLVVDGIAGARSMEAACLQRIAASDSSTPIGLMRGMVQGESGFWLGASSPTYFRNGVRKADVGAAQFQTTLADEAAVRRALNLPLSMDRLSDFLVEGHAVYRAAAFVRKHDTPERIAWWLACGRWNAPAWTDIWASRGPNDAELQVLVTHPRLGLITREQWVRTYVSDKIVFVDDWTV